MGGNALKNTTTRRFEREEFIQVSSEVLVRLIGNTDAYAHIIKSYHTKESFGDVDILYKTSGDTPITVDDIRRIFNPNEIVKNYDVISFDYKELQVDIIHAPIKTFEYAHNYFAYNDLGNLIGKLAHNFGLKHGHQGLILPLRDGDNKFADVLITTDYFKTLKFLGLDVERFKQGFETLEDIFTFVSSSCYFNPKSYSLDTLSHIARIRDKKRSTYNAFLKFCDAYTGPVFTREACKKTYLPMIMEAFPECIENVNRALSDLHAQQIAKQKFNGDIVSQLTGLVDKELGKFMKVLRTKPAFSLGSVLYLSTEQLSDIIVKEYAKFKATSA